MYKRFTLALFMMLSLVVSPFMTPSAKAVTVNTLIKTESSSAVYWYAADGKRYVFPSARTFYSWFTDTDLARVLTVTPYELASIPLGGNVTYRPGARLIKITTDPRVYAVGRYGTLRWITSEALAQQLYGLNWAQQVDDVPDEYFTNYRVTDAIYTSSQYNVPFELGQARSPSENVASTIIGDPYAPNSSITGQVSLSLSNTTPVVGQTVTFTARITNSSNNPTDFSLSIISVTGETLRTCAGALTCSYDWYIDANQSGFGRTYYARITHRNGRVLDSNGVTLQVGGSTNANAVPTISVNRAYPAIGETVTLTVNTNGLNANSGVLSILGPNGSIIQSCQTGSSSCSYSFVMDSTIASNMTLGSSGSYGYTGRFVPTYTGIPANTSPVYVYSPTRTNPNNQVPGTSMVLTFDTAQAYVGQSFHVTASIYPQTNVAPYYTIRIYDQWNILQHTCYNVRTCVLEQTLSATTDANRTYYATATAENGQQLASGNQTIVVQPNQQSTNARRGSSVVALGVSSDNSVSVVPYLTVNSGVEFRLSGDIQPAISNPVGIVMKFLDTNNSVIATCGGYNNCSTTKAISNTTSQDLAFGFKVRIEDAFGSTYESPLSYVIIRPAQQQVGGNAFTNGFLTAGIDHSSIKANDRFNLTATVSNTIVPTQNLKITWHQSSNDALITTCESVNPCIANTAYGTIAGQSQTLSFYAKAVDRSGTYSGELRSSPVMVTIVP